MQFTHIIILVALLSPTLSNGNLDDRNHAQRYCGMYLTKMLAVVCQGNYNDLKIYRKRRSVEPLPETDPQDTIIKALFNSQESVREEEARQKAQESEESTRRTHPKAESDQQPKGLPFISKKVATSFAKHFRRQKRGVVNECCDKPCTYNELKSYCAD